MSAACSWGPEAGSRRKARSEMDFFQGKNAVVTGAGSGIGKALARGLASKGCRTIVVTDIDQGRLDATVEELDGLGVRAEGFKVDHSSRDEASAFADAFFARYYHCDVLCQNAGVGLGGTFLETSLDEFEWVMNINLWGAIYMLHFFVPRMAERGRGSVLATASDAGLVPLPYMSAYNVTKFGVVGLVETVRTELADRNVKFTLLCPGDIKTNIIKDNPLHIYDRAGVSNKDAVEKYYEEKGEDPAVVAEAALRGLEKNRPIVIVPWAHHGYLWDLHRLSPALYHRVMAAALKLGVFHRMMGMRK